MDYKKINDSKIIKIYSLLLKTNLIDYLINIVYDYLLDKTILNIYNINNCNNTYDDTYCINHKCTFINCNIKKSQKIIFVKSMIVM